MVNQTVIHPTISSLKKLAEDKLIQNADKYLLNSRYKLGDSYCREEQAHLSMIYDIIKKDNCELNSLIVKKLEETKNCDNNIHQGGTMRSISSGVNVVDWFKIT